MRRVILKAARGSKALRILGANLVRHEAGSFAILSAVLLSCLIIAAGCAIDISRLVSARTNAQVIVDAATLAAAASVKDSVVDLKTIAAQYLKNGQSSDAAAIRLTAFSVDKNKNLVSVEANGEVPTTFMKFVSIKTMPFTIFAQAKRTGPQAVEVVLVLDNTWSMNGEKLAALKQAALNLVAIAEKNNKGRLKIGLVPYADYVNVGVQNRYQPWVSVRQDYLATTPQSCWMETTKTECTRGPQKFCTRVVDGIPEKYDCTEWQCVAIPITPYRKCVGGDTIPYKWYGCVGSRTSNALHLSDESPSIPYPGLLNWRQNCLNPIIPLTSAIDLIRTEILKMVVQVGDYRPETYIPAGLVWGINVLSPTRPFTEGAAFSEDNVNPKKVMVLMTDGANTLILDKSTGQHVHATSKTQLAKTYSDMQALCLYARSKKIDVFTVSFMVSEDEGRKAMADCASNPQYNFDASTPQDLIAAFTKIATSFSKVILVK